MRTVVAGDLAIIAGPGAIGLLTLQVVKASGATVVMLGTDADGHRLTLASELGADYILNVQQDDPTDLIVEISDEGLGADVVSQRSGGRTGGSNNYCHWCVNEAAIPRLDSSASPLPGI